MAEIAARAGLTERTFFRHFADKREVLFGRAGLSRSFIVRAVTSAPDAVAPLEAVTTAPGAAGTVFWENAEGLRKRQTVIAANAELQARELSKLAALALVIRGALSQRGVVDPVASLTAEAGIVVFRTAFERWTGQQDGSQLVCERLDELKTVTGDETSPVDPQ